ncbi:fructosamine-3-kinase [Methyloglobulus morosus KoM1]|uniref:Fructosamine-3-kinase n=1 Tax=Methyloglobulus morosus KoM1 TaxID=1116472 RepID=V5DZI8_9GAMM|nr:fructosamine kinase family protein [Methyloglobulus morosus]ESS72711.1 fructosamine-3-kinase [Methyloglobulus morosus KoM1]
MNWQPIVEQIENATGSAFKLLNVRPLAGGDINSAYCLQGAGKSYFVKINRAETIAMFAAEAAGLTELAATRTVRIPALVAYGQSAEHAFLVLEYIEFGTANKNSDRLFGQQLALLHRQPQSFFGWHRNNTIGSTPQPNDKNDDWITFWRTQRVQHQLRLAAAKGYRGRLETLGPKLCEMLGHFFEGYRPHPALLHGDLWGGNVSTDGQGNPVIFDPACYYGDREADLAMTELFGGFSPDFYTAYRDTYSLDPGYTTRKKLYNLYHILNHLNLFGSGYLRQAEMMMDSLLAEVR